MYRVAVVHVSFGSQFVFKIERLFFILLNVCAEHVLILCAKSPICVQTVVQIETTNEAKNWLQSCMASYSSLLECC